jgi:Zn-dependent protease
MRAGWLFGVGFVACILIHELGHAFAIRRHGLASSWPVFIPFVGAFITLQTAAMSPAVEAEIGIAGPMWGAMASLGAVVLYYATSNTVWLAVAMTVFLMNLFNLIPIRPLDGGRVAQLFSRRAWLLGMVLLVLLFVYTLSPVLLLLGLAGIPRAFREHNKTDLHAIPKAVRLRVALEYFGLAAFLAAGFYFSNTLLHGR